MTIGNKTPLQELLNDFGVITYELDNCKRQIMAWITIGKSVKTNTDAEIDNFFGWIQDTFNRLIIIDAYKIYKDSKKYIKGILEKSDYAPVSDKLLQKSAFNQRLTALGKVIQPLKNFRNKRFAHIEKYTLQRLELHLIELSTALLDLNYSVWFIIHYISNPQYLSSLDNNEQSYFYLDKSEPTLEALEGRLKEDKILKTMKQVKLLFGN